MDKQIGGKELLAMKAGDSAMVHIADEEPVAAIVDNVRPDSVTFTSLAWDEPVIVVLDEKGWPSDENGAAVEVIIPEDEDEEVEDIANRLAGEEEKEA